MKSYGAEEAFDYKSPTCATDIRTYTRNSLRYVLDTVAEAETMKLCYAAIGRAGGKYTALELYSEDLATRKMVKPDWVMGIEMLGKKIALEYGYAREPNAELRVFGEKWFRQVQRMVDEGRIRSHPVRVMGGGFEGILQGLDLMRNRTVSGEKLVYQIGRTEN